MDGFSPIDSKPKEHMESAEDESSRAQLIHRVREPKQKGKGVSVGGSGAGGHNVQFLRRIPVDPMTSRKRKGSAFRPTRPRFHEFGGHSVFDVCSKSTATALAWIIHDFASKKRKGALKD